MPKSPDTSSITIAGKQYRATIPKPIAEALNIETGQKVKWTIKAKDKAEFQIIK